MKRRQMLQAVCIFLVGALVVGCGGNAADKNAGDTIKVGGWSALSGPLASLGVPVAAGTKVFFDQLNAKGGIGGKKV